MCAVCWTGAQIIPVSAVAGRYVWVNHMRGRRGPARPGPTDAEPVAPEEVAERMPASDVLVVAHRTLPLDHPENSLAGIVGAAATPAPTRSRSTCGSPGTGWPC